MTKKNFCIYWLPVIIYAILILGLSSIPELPPSPYEIPHLDKLLHVIEFAGFGILLARAFRSINFSNFRILVVIIGLFYGIIDESYQFLIPNRLPSYIDLIFDTFGAFLGQLFIHK